ncbi:MAG: lysostaphin resistance A-like protein [Acidimicrobiia bacterium]
MPSWGLGEVAAGIGLALVVPSIVILVALAAVGVDADDTDTIPLWGVALLQLPLWAVLVGVPWWAVRTKGSGSLRADLGLAFRLRDAWIGLLTGFGTQIALGFVLLPVYELLGIDRDEVGRTAEELADRAHGAVGLVSRFVVAVVGAALVEELFYRGLVLRALRKRSGATVAIVGSAVIFGVMHFQPVDTIALGLFGAVCAWLTVRHDRLGPAVWAHLGFNLTAFVALVWN